MRDTLPMLVLLLLSAMILTPAAAETKPGVKPEGGESMLPADPLGEARVQVLGGSGAGRVVEVDDDADVPFERALRVESPTKAAKPWQVEALVPVTGGVERGDVLLMSFWMRAVEGNAESADVTVTGMVQRFPVVYTPLGDLQATAGPEWTRIFLPITAGESVQPGGLRLSFHAAYDRQTLDLAGFELLNYGRGVDVTTLPRTKADYGGRDPDAEWRKGAQERIEHHRKGDLTVRVIDAQGQPVPGAKVRVEQTRHAFGFGNILNLNTFVRDDIGANAEKYREVFAANFNKGATESGFRWHNWYMPERRGALDEHKEHLDALLTWCKQHDIPVRAHYLAWGTFNKPEYQPADYIASPDQLWPDLKAHIERMTDFTRGRVAEWDAVNHPLGWGPKTMIDVTGSPEIYAKVIRLGRERAPDAEMWINEGQVLPGGSGRDDYYEHAKWLIEHDAAPDGIGFMGHFRGGSLTPIPRLYEIFDKYAQLGPELQLTELDVEVGQDEQLQADYLRDVLTIAFSHPKMDGIVQWGFWEGRHWRPAAALWRRDWTIKPAGEAYRDLVFDRWWTQLEGETDAKGAYVGRGFLGKYRVTAEADGREAMAEFTLDREGGEWTLKLDGNQNRRR